MWLSRTTRAPVKARSRRDGLADHGGAQVAHVHLLRRVGGAVVDDPGLAGVRGGGAGGEVVPGAVRSSATPRSRAGLAAKLMNPGPATDTSKPSRTSPGRAEATASAIGRGGFPAFFAAARTPLAWKSPCRGSAVRTPGSKLPVSRPAEAAASLRALASLAIKSKAKVHSALHHPAGGRRKRGVLCAVLARHFHGSVLARTLSRSRGPSFTRPSTP